VQKFNGSSVHVCDWDSVWTRDETETLNLSDPLLEEMPTWTRNAPPSPTSNGSDCDPILDRVADEYQCGRYELAYACLREFTRANLQPGSSARMRYSGLMALVLSRRGFFPDAMAIMGTRGRQDWNSFSTVCEGVAIQRFKSLVPGEGIWELARRGDALAEQSALEAQDWVFSLQAHKGCALLHAGRLDDARTVLVQSLADSPLESSQAQMFALATADLAEIYRRLGEPALARNCLDEAERIQTGGGFFGDLTDFTMLTRAKLESVDGDVSGLLARAESIQIQNTNRMGLVRTLILKARLLHDAASANANKERILQIQQQLPSLQECPVCERILEGWDDWCAGKPPLAGQDQFWGM
jgi:tetratricopeptide (TPR) repeat protein